MIELRKLGPDTLRHAMVVVTDSFEREVAAGEREEDFDEAWGEAFQAFSVVAGGGDFAGFVGYDGSYPVAISLLRGSEAYGEGVGVFDWFYVSPDVKASTFPLRLATETIKAAKGIKEVVAFVGWGKNKTMKALEIVGMEPYEVEFRGRIKDMPRSIKNRLE